MRNITRITKIDGEVKERDKLLIWFNRYLDNMPDSDQLLTIEKTNRTDAQNKYYWGAVLQIISKSVGESRERLHMVFKEMFLPKEEYLVLVKKKQLESTTQADTDEFSKYIFSITQWASEQGIYIPDIEEYKHKNR